MSDATTTPAAWDKARDEVLAARDQLHRDLSRDERRALMDRYIVLTLRALVRTGKVMPT